MSLADWLRCLLTLGGDRLAEVARVVAYFRLIGWRIVLDAVPSDDAESSVDKQTRHAIARWEAAVSATPVGIEPRYG